MAISPDTAPAAAPQAPQAPRRLPFAFAKRHGVLIQDVRDGQLEAIYRAGASPLGLAEARRFVGVPIRFVEVDSESFDLRLQAAYESGAAMTMVEGLDGETD
jgi:general secretion pathway protein E